MPLLCDEAVSQKLHIFDFVEREKKERDLDLEPHDGSESFAPNPLARILSAILQPPLPQLLQEGPLDWPMPLLAHQQVGIAALLHNRELLLADEMGLGKTIQALGALRILAYLGLAARSLVVVPASLLRQWQKEAALWAPELAVVRISGAPQQRAALWRLPAHIHLVAYETLREDMDSRPVSGKAWDVVVLDEASKIRNPESRLARCVKRLKAARRWALTGTPIENRVDDLHSILGFLVKDWSDLPATLRRIQLRRRKADVLEDLPAKTVVTVPLELGREQREAYNAAERDGIYRLRSLGPALTITHVLELLVRLKQICNVDPDSGRSVKIEDIEQRIGELSEAGHRALVFSQFTDETFGVAMIARRLAQYRPLVYTGDLSGARRAEQIERFTRDESHKALILSLQAGGLGLNLQSASYVFHLDRWWNPAIEDQAEARSHRMGQTLPVTVYRYVCEGTIEERIDQLQRQKRELFEQTIDGVSLEPSHVLSQAEIFGLLGL